MTSQQRKASKLKSQPALQLYIPARQGTSISREACSGWQSSRARHSAFPTDDMTIRSMRSRTSSAEAGGTRATLGRKAVADYMCTCPAMSQASVARFTENSRWLREKCPQPSLPHSCAAQ